MQYTMIKHTSNRVVIVKVRHGMASSVCGRQANSMQMRLSWMLGIMILGGNPKEEGLAMS